MKNEKLTFGQMVAGFIAGLSPAVLARCDDDEKAKAYTMATLLMIPFLIATISAGVLMNEFTDVEHPFALGMIYGLIILIIDRAIVSIIEPGIAITLGRIVFALLLSFTMSFPLKLHIFSDLITEELSENLNAKKEIITNEFGKKDKLLKAELSTQDAYVKDLYEILDAERDGTAGTGVRGNGSIAAKKEEKYEIEKVKLGEIQAIYLTQKDSLNVKFLAALKSTESVHGHGFSAKLKALGRIVEREPLVLITMILIIIIIASLETLPLIIKSATAKNAMYSKIVLSDRQAAIDAVEKTNALKTEAYILRSSLPIEEQIATDKFALAAIKATGEVKTASEYSNALVDLIIEENRARQKLNGQNLSPEVFDRLSDRLTEIFDQYAENVYNHSKNYENFNL